MKKDILTSLEGVDIYPVISLLIFVLFFVGMAVFVFTMKRSHIDAMKAMPLEDDTVSSCGSGCKACPSCKDKH
ncbi:MAG: cbb3-type cytochrome c oxidase subunit 3 [Cyclobacteriaceae bacterium]|nr:cbb3-type cytochrome c oxidase subunit 3 [Cyclobacteriaceae bacterium]MCH8514955.1 cbb3-type cytochrome c oxidase subunit 3 [Cyclobacteriaceae bacterium]